MAIIYSKDGTPIAYWHSGVGTPLLLVHGSTEDHFAWESVLPALEPYFSLYVLDRRGRGCSGDGAVYTFEREWEDIATVIDAIGGPVDIVGHSFGGTCALEAARLSANIHRMILYEPPMPFGKRYWPLEFSKRMQAYLDAGKAEQALLLFFTEIANKPPHEINAAQASTMWPERIATVNTVPRELQSLDGYVFDPRQFRTIRTPIMIFLGSESPSFIKNDMKRLCAMLPSCQIMVLVGQQHVAMQTAPDLFAQEVIKFLTTTSGTIGID